MAYLLAILIFLVTGAATFALYMLTLRHRERRLHLRLQEEDDWAAPEPLLGDMTAVLAEQLPMKQDKRSEIERELRVAGYYRPTALMEYAALRAVFIIAPLLAAGVIALYVDSLNATLWVWGSGVLLAISGYSLPRIYVYYRGQVRMHRIERALPTAMDMLVLCLGAGLNVLNSLQRVTMELAKAYPILAEEFAIIQRQAELRSLEFALSQFADRVGLPQARNLALMLGQSEGPGDRCRGCAQRVRRRLAYQHAATCRRNV